MQWDGPVNTCDPLILKYKEQVMFSSVKIKAFKMKPELIGKYLHRPRI